MAACSPTTTMNPTSSTFPKSYVPKQMSSFTIPFPINTKNTSLFNSNPRRHTISKVMSSPPTTKTSDDPIKGSDILVKALEREGVTHVFAYPGRASLEIHHALTRSEIIRNILPRNEEGGVFAAAGYARSSGRPGVCISTSGAGATNLFSGLAHALFDSVPMVAITGAYGCLETSIVEVTRSIAKHNYLVLHVEDIPRVVKEAFHLATTGRPGPVLIDIPKDIQQQLSVPDWDQPMKLDAYDSRFCQPPSQVLLEHIVMLISESKSPMLYVGGGCLNSGEELKKFVELTGIPVASTLMGLGCYPCSDELSLQMLGMDGTGFANYSVDKSDLMLAFGVRFDDHVTRKLEAIASSAKIVHIDIDPAEIGKNKQPHVSICGDVKLALAGLNSILEEREGNLKFNFSSWREELNEQKRKYQLTSKTFGDAILPQDPIQTLDELTKGNAIITTGIGQHRMWAAQFYKYNRPRQWLTSGKLGAMGFGLPTAIGAVVARPDSIVVDIDGDGSFMMNMLDLATVLVENVPVKIMLLNNQQPFYKANRAHTFLGDPSSEEPEIFPNMLIAKAYNIPAAQVSKIDHLRPAIQKMLDTPGPYLLDVIVSHQEHVPPCP